MNDNERPEPVAATPTPTHERPKHDSMSSTNVAAGETRRFGINQDNSNFLKYLDRA